MSFWNTSDGQKVDNSNEYEAGGGDIEPIPNNTLLISMITEAKWAEYEGDRYINLRWDVLEGEYKNRVIFQKVRVIDDDAKRADKAKRMLAAIDANAGGKLFSTDSEPTDMQLAANLCNKPMMITVRIWEIKDDNGNIEKQGNWVAAVQGSTGAKPKPAQKPAQNQQQQSKADDFDDDIPF